MVELTARARTAVTSLNRAYPLRYSELESLVCIDRAPVGLVRFRDELRHETEPFLDHGKSCQLIESVILLSGHRSRFDSRGEGWPSGSLDRACGRTPDEANWWRYTASTGVRSGGRHKTVLSYLVAQVATRDLQMASCFSLHTIRHIQGSFEQRSLEAR